MSEAEITIAAEAGRLQIAAREREALEYAQLMSAPTPVQLHAARMSDPEYARRFINRSMPKGHEFCVVLECVNEIDSQQLWEAAESIRPLSDAEKRVGVKREPVLLAGCRVIGVYKKNIGLDLVELKRTLIQLGSAE